MMVVTGILISLAVSGALAAYLFYAVSSVPSDIEQRDHVFRVFAKEKYLRGLVSLVFYTDTKVCDKAGQQQRVQRSFILDDLGELVPEKH